MAQFAEIVIALRRQQPGREQEGYPVEIRYFPIDSDSEECIPSKGTAFAKIDLEELETATGEDYGRKLGGWLFENPEIRGVIKIARESLNAKGVQDNIPLLGKPAVRIRLDIDGAVREDLHRIQWERLCDGDGAELFKDSDMLFSRYLPSSNWYPPGAKADLKALIVIAQCAGKEEVDVEGELKRAKAGLAKAGISEPKVLATAQPGLPAATLENLEMELEAGGFDILYLVCHGSYQKLGKQPILYLEDGAHVASKLVEKIRSKRLLRLAILASCESAGSGVIASDTLSAIGPLLVDAGVPAVLAMQGKVRMTTVEAFMPAFFEELKNEGQIDRATAAGRTAARGAGARDYWMPVLFMRLKTGRLWYRPGSSKGPKAEEETWEKLDDALKADALTPVLGPGVLAGLIGTTREIAESLGGDKFPFLSGMELPAVAQYMKIRKGKPYSVNVKALFAERIAERLGVKDWKPDRQQSLACLLREAGKHARESNPLDPHTILAKRRCKIYLTVNADTLMEDALEAEGRHPRSDFSRWNNDPYLDLMNPSKYPPLWGVGGREPNYEPSEDNPLVYHLFGMWELPAPSGAEPKSRRAASRAEAGLGSVALTEDDYFQYMLGIGSQSKVQGGDYDPAGEALAFNSLLFLGFRLQDWSFRVLLRSIFDRPGAEARRVGDNDRSCFCAQIEPDENQVRQPELAAKYFEDYLDKAGTEIFWGSAEEFLKEFESNVGSGKWEQPK